MANKIKILIGLDTAIAPLPLRKRTAVCMLILLKDAYEETGKIRAPFYRAGCKQINKEAYRQAADAIGTSLRSLERNIKILTKLEVVTIEDDKCKVVSLELVTFEHGMCKFASWEDIQAGFKLEHNNKFIHLLYDPVAIATANNGYNLVHEMKWMAARNKTKDQENAIRTNIHHNPEIKKEIKTATDLRHWDKDAVFHAQLDSYMNEGRGMDTEQFEILQSMRCDTACSTDCYNYLFEYHSRGGMAYQKRRWEEMGMIRVIHRMHELDPHTFSKRDEREYSRYGDIVWMDPDATPSTWKNVKPEDRVQATEKRLWLVMPDEIYWINPKARKWMKAA